MLGGINAGNILQLPVKQINCSFLSNDDPTIHENLEEIDDIVFKIRSNQYHEHSDLLIPENGVMNIAFEVEAEEQIFENCVYDFEITSLYAKYLGNEPEEDIELLSVDDISEILKDYLWKKELSITKENEKWHCAKIQSIKTNESILVDSLAIIISVKIYRTYTNSENDEREQIVQNALFGCNIGVGWSGTTP